MQPDEKDLLLFCRFLNENRIVIADRSSAARVRIANTLSQLGVRTANLSLCSSSADAIEKIKEVKPRLVLCDYNLGDMSGMDLLQFQRAAHNNDECIFILITGNASQVAVARAAEEDVDSFILKPYTLESLKNSLVNAVVAKIRPSDYMKTIKESKSLLFGQKIDESIQILEKAVKLETAPTLAFFYLGYAQKMKNSIEIAEAKYKEGLSLNKIHYKCLTGLFDLLMEEKRNDEAYDVVKRIAQYFPANPKRLSSVLRLAIMTENYQDMEGYYKIFTQLEQRPDEVVNYMCSALIVCGKYYLINQHQSRALEIFEKAAVSCGSHYRFLKYIIEALVENGQSDAAVPYFKRYSNSDRTSTTYRTLEFLIGDKKEDLATTLNKGHALLKLGIKNPLVYQTMIECCSKAGMADAATNLVAIATREFPEKKNDFELLMENYLEEKPELETTSEAHSS